MRNLKTYKVITELDKDLKTLSSDKNTTIMKPLPFQHLSDGDVEDVVVGTPSWGIVTSDSSDGKRKYVQCVLLTDTGEEIPVSRALCDLVKPKSKLSITIKTENVEYTNSAGEDKSININKAIFNGLEDIS